MRRVWVTAAVLAGIALAVAGCTPPGGKPAVSIDVDIGTASMAADGTIRLQLRATTLTGKPVDMGRTVKPRDADYEAVRAHLPGIVPGKSVPIPMDGYDFGPHDRKP